MNGTVARVARFGTGLTILVTLAWVLTGHAAKPLHRGMPLPTDWTHRHVIFSRAVDPQRAARVQEDIRFQQQLQRSQPATLLADRAAEDSVAATLTSIRSPRRQTGKMQGLWSEDLGSLSGSGELAGVYPAKFSFDPTTAASCSNDFVVFSTGLPGTSSQPTIVAFNNLYSGCSGSVPSLYFSYNISGTDILTTAVSSASMLTSPVFSRDGTQIAFTVDTGFFSELVILKWAPGTGTMIAPATPSSAGTFTYRTCTAPCMMMRPLTTGPGPGEGTPTQDTGSSVFYDYNSDAAWVGDNTGWLHKFANVFLGTPQEVRTGGWPIQPSLNALSSPVYDHVSQNVFVGDFLGGFLFRVDPTPAVTASGEVDFWNGITAGPIVDSSNGLVYVSVSDDGSGGCDGGLDDCAGVFQFSTSFASGDVGSEALVGNAGGAFSTPPPTANLMYDGGFDNAYLQSTNGSGNFYVCGNTGGAPSLYQVPISAGVLGTPVAIATLTGAAQSPACSSVTDISIPSATAGSAATEHIFYSVQNNSNATVCGGGGCVQNFNDTPWQAKTLFSVGQEILVKSSSPATRYIDTAIASTGITGTVQPSWPTTAGTTKVDGGVTWINQGNPIVPPGTWAANTTFPLHTRILDTNGNVEVVTGPSHGSGTTGATQPTWPTNAPTNAGTTTSDGTITWTNAGQWPANSLAATGGASGIIIDNIVTTGAPAGTSQVYFTTLGNQTCTTSGGNGGCAVQASQSALQ